MSHHAPVDAQGHFQPEYDYKKHEFETISVIFLIPLKTSSPGIVTDFGCYSISTSPELQYANEFTQLAHYRNNVGDRPALFTYDGYSRHRDSANSDY